MSGVGRAGFGEVADAALDELIFGVASEALLSAGLKRKDVDYVVIASSDVHDGRSNSTMTLTGATGSFRCPELRVCSDSIVALGVASAALESGLAMRVLVASWSYTAGIDLQTLEALALSPLTRDLLGDGVSAALIRSNESGRPANVEAVRVGGSNSAVAMVLRCPEAGGPALGRIAGTGWWTDPWVGPSRPNAIARAIEIATSSADRRPSEFATVVTANLHDIADDELGRLAQVDSASVHRCGPAAVDVGYAAGLFAVVEALLSHRDGWQLVVSAIGIRAQSAAAAVVVGKP